MYVCACARAQYFTEFTRIHSVKQYFNRYTCMGNKNSLGLLGPSWTHITIIRHVAQSMILSSSAVTGVHFQTNLGVSDMDISQ